MTRLVTANSVKGLRAARHAILSCALAVAALSPAAAWSAQESGSNREIDWARERQFWSFHAPRPQPRPGLIDRAWARQPIDYFVRDRLEQQGLAPSREADQLVLLRRLTYDLTGLPPTVEERDRFLGDSSGDVYERLVDRLLASPRFGERMASMWLPLARYAEDQAHQVGDDTKFFYPNAYKYRAWVIDAFNRDLPYDQFVSLQLAADKLQGADSADLVALGFLGLGPKYYNRNRVDVMADEWEDRVDTVTRAMLGLTVACARCHDHKFEPITQQDYYALAGVFASTRMVNRTKDGQVEKDVKQEKEDTKADKMPLDTMHIVEDGDVQNLNVFVRGNVEQKGSLAQRRFVQLLCGDDAMPFQDGSGRKELADAIASPQNPLTARVLVNRVWALLFGRPLVATPSNFGHSGQPPSHPELLDDLASRFIDGGWSIKQLVRELVLSATYRQSSESDSLKATIDPDNALYWRMSRRRLSVEQWRDSLLFVAGNLEQEGGKSQELTDIANHRRTVYSRISRLKLDDFLMQFDYPDANVHAERRVSTTTATQKLFLLNSPFVMAQAATFAQQFPCDAGGHNEARIVEAYERLFGRPPSLEELRLAVNYLRKPGADAASRWDAYTQMLLVSNEMLFLD
jgi:hypothetical protein